MKSEILIMVRWAGLVAVFGTSMVVGWWAAQSAGARTEAAPGESATARKPASLNSGRPTSLLIAMPLGFTEVTSRTLRDHGNLDQQIRAALAMAERCPLEDIPAMLKQIARLQGRQGIAAEMLQYILMTRWAETAPEEALWLALQTPGRSRRPDELDPLLVLQTLASLEPKLLLNHWPEVLQSLKDYDGGANSFIVEVLAAAPERTTELLATLRQEPELSNAYIAALWSIDPEEAKRTALEEGKMNELLDCWFGEDPQTAGRWALEHAPKGLGWPKLAAWVAADLPGSLQFFSQEASAEAQLSLLRPLSLEIGKDDPKQGIDWLMPQAESKERTMALSTQLADWVARDTEAATTWLGEQPAGAQHDTLVRSFSYLALALDPATSFEWVATIADPKIREHTYNRNYDYWWREDPEAARAWLDSGPAVPEEQLQQWREKN